MLQLTDLNETNVLRTLFWIWSGKRRVKSWYNHEAQAVQTRISKLRKMVNPWFFSVSPSRDLQDNGETCKPGKRWSKCNCPTLQLRAFHNETWSRIIQLEFWSQEKEKCEEVQGTILLRGTVGLRGVSGCRTQCLFNGFTAFSAWLPGRRRCDFVFSSNLFRRWWSLLFGYFCTYVGLVSKAALFEIQIGRLN